MLNRTYRMLATALCCGTTAGLAGADLVTNGGFELSDIATDTSTDADTALSGWTVTRALDGTGGASNVFLHDGGFFGVSLTGAVAPGTNEAREGSQYVAFNANQGSGSGVLSQDLATAVGLEYTVEFSIAGAFSAGQQSVTVDAGGINSLTQSATDGEWTTHTFNFVATGTTTTLSISDNLGAGSSIDNDLLIDAVSVNQVPEPGSLALLGLGGLFIARRRK
ncbi:DUF642 domain-containing protein [Phycisphaeraceae bacterium D3-23]